MSVSVYAFVCVMSVYEYMSIHVYVYMSAVASEILFVHVHV